MRKALIVGIDDYPSQPLSACVHDATSMSAVLERNGSGSPNFDVVLLVSPGDSVTRSSLKHAIDELFRGDPEVALLYFSGHGFISNTGGYLVTPDAARYDEGVSMDDVLAMANKSKAINKVVIVDCCHSGAMGTPATGPSATAMLSEGLTVLTASRSDEAAIAGPSSSVFTALVLDALQGGAADLRGHVTPGSIYAHVDQALGAWDQRPLFRTNVSRFVSLREIPPRVPADILRRLALHFATPATQLDLDPEFEPTSPTPDPAKNAVFAELQQLQKVGLVEPVGEEHMYYAAMNSKCCRLTALGTHYWRLAKEKKV